MLAYRQLALINNAHFIVLTSDQVVGVLRKPAPTNFRWSVRRRVRMMDQKRSNGQRHEHWSE